MAVICIKGEKKDYLFSVIQADYSNMPEWGGIYLAVHASGMGIRMEDCVALGSCDNFKKYAEKIQKFTEGKCTHLYLLPEFEVKNRKFAIEDLMAMPDFQNALLRTMEIETLNIDSKVAEKKAQVKNQEQVVKERMTALMNTHAENKP